MQAAESAATAVCCLGVFVCFFSDACEREMSKR